MDLKEFNFSEVLDVNFAFPTFRVIPELLEESKSRGFYEGNTKYNRLFNKLFFSGGKLIFKKNISEKFKNECTGYLKCFMGSYEPKHEEKDAICALLLSELVDIKKYKELK